MPRLLVVRLLIGLILLEFISSLWLIPLTLEIAGAALLLFLGFSGVYYSMYRSRRYIVERSFR